MCLDMAKWAASYKVARSCKQEGKKGVIRYKLLRKIENQYEGPYYGWTYEKHVVYKARLVKLDDYFSGFHVFNSEKDVKSYKKTGEQGSVVKVLCWGLIAQGPQYGIPCEVYKYMMIL